MEKAWPARMERARKSSASGNCSSSVSSRFLRLCRTNRYGSEPKTQRQDDRGGRRRSTGTASCSPARTPESPSAPSRSAGALDDQFSPGLLDLFLPHAWKTAAGETAASDPVGLSGLDFLQQVADGDHGLAGGGLQHADHLLLAAGVEDTSARR